MYVIVIVTLFNVGHNLPANEFVIQSFICNWRYCWLGLGGRRKAIDFNPEPLICLYTASDFSNEPLWNPVKTDTERLLPLEITWVFY